MPNTLRSRKCSFSRRRLNLKVFIVGIHRIMFVYSPYSGELQYQLCNRKSNVNDIFKRFKDRPAYGTSLVLSKPLVHALNMEKMEAGQPPYILINLKLRETYCAFVSLFLLLFLPFLFLSICWNRSPLGKFMGKSVPLNAGSACSSVHAATSPSSLQ